MSSIRRQLTEKSWVDFFPQVIECTQEQFDEFWDQHPTVRHEILIMGRLTPIPRWQALYGSGSYKFSGTSMAGNPVIPEFVELCFEAARKLYPDYNWNGALVNWYPDGASYIGAHSDDERDLVADAPILSFSFGGVRTFRVKKKMAAKPGEIGAIDFPTEHCSMLAMCGAMQKEYKHEITKTAKFVAPRINVTIRCFVR